LNKILFIIIFLSLSSSCSSPGVNDKTTEKLEHDLLKKLETKEGQLSPKKNPPKKNISKKVAIELKNHVGVKKESSKNIVLTKGPLIQESKKGSVSISGAKDFAQRNKKLDFPAKVAQLIKTRFDYRYKVSLIGVVMGELRRFSKNVDDQEFILAGTLKNNSFYKYLYSINDSITTNVRKSDLYPILVNLVKNENKRSSVSIQKMLDGKVSFFENNIKNGKKSSRERSVKFTGHYYDPLLFLRFIEVSDVENLIGDKFPVIYSGKLYYLKVKEVKKIKREWKGQPINVQKIFFDTIRNNKIKKDQKISIEKTTGKNSRIVSLQGKMKVGVLHGEILE